MKIHVLAKIKEDIMSIRPLGDKLVIKVIEDTQKTSAGIFITDSAKEKPQKC